MTPKRAYFLMLGLFLLTMIAIGAGLYFVDKTLASKALKTGELQVDVDLLQEQVRVSTEASSKAEELAYINDLAKEVLPQEKDQAALVALILQIAREAGLTIDSVSFSPTSDAPGATTQTKPLEGATGILVFPYTIAFESNYDQLLNFLKKTEENRRKMAVTNLTITPLRSEDGDLTGRLDVKVEFQVYMKAG